MGVEITVIDDRVDPGSWYYVPRYTGKMAAWTRLGEVYMTSATTMVEAVLGKARGAKIGWLNVLDHGNRTGIELGSDWITSSNVWSYEPTLRRLNGHFVQNATVHLQHCEAGQNDALMMALARIWGANIRAGRGLHNPVYRFNASRQPYRICNGSSCWDER